MDQAPETTELALDQEVECKAGRGMITYLEDGFMEVTLRDGTERNFWAPFEGKVWAYSAPEIVSNEDICIRILGHERLEPLIAAAALYHQAVGQKIKAIGGESAGWGELTNVQKVNFLAIILNVSAEWLIRAEQQGRISEFLEKQ